MRYVYLPFVALTLCLTTACASRQAQPETPGNPPAASKEDVKPAAAPAGEVVGKPAKGSKFAKLKIGMTLKQVEKLIGPPTSQWKRPTGKAHIPFYFGDDRWQIEYAYSKEGRLTFNYGGEQSLVRIVVDTKQ